MPCRRRPRSAAFTTDGVRSGTNSEEFLIGGATFSVAAGATGQTIVNYFQHRTSSGGNNLAWGDFLIDGNQGNTSARNPTNTWIEGSGVELNQVIPEPGALALVGIGVLGLLVRRERSA